MTRTIPFTKMHGAGNDYIYVNVIENYIDNPQAAALLWSDRHKGIGADGLVLIGLSAKADFNMRIFNADGSEALMCGNASRCVGKYVYEKGLTNKKTISLETLSGIKELKLEVASGRVKEVTVNMGAPSIINPSQTLEAGGTTWTGAAVSMGNPHFVIFTKDAEAINLSEIGPIIENHPDFSPGRTNVEFVQILNNNEIRMRVWERGSGITMACGTGACASAVATANAGLTTTDVKVHMDGGTLSIRWDKAAATVYKTGPAATVFEGLITVN